MMLGFLSKNKKTIEMSALKNRLQIIFQAFACLFAADLCFWKKTPNAPPVWSSSKQNHLHHVIFSPWSKRHVYLSWIWILFPSSCFHFFFTKFAVLWNFFNLFLKCFYKTWICCFSPENIKNNDLEICVWFQVGLKVYVFRMVVSLFHVTFRPVSQRLRKTESSAASDPKHQSLENKPESEQQSSLLPPAGGCLPAPPQEKIQGGGGLRLTGTISAPLHIW